MKKVLHAFLLAAGATVVSLLLWKAGALDRLEYATWSWRVTALAKPSAATADIKIVFLNQASLDWGARENGLPWPWPRSVYAPLIQFCRRSGSQVVTFDMVYSEPGEMGVEDDALLGAAIGEGRDFINAFFIGEQSTETAWPETVPVRTLSVEDLDAWLTPARREALTEPRATFPIPDVATNATVLASAKDVPDSDGVFRRVTPFRLFDGKAIPSVGFAAYLLAQARAAGRGDDANPLDAVPLRIEEGWLHVGDRRVPIDDLGRVTLRFRGPSGTHEAFSAAAVIQSELQAAAGETPNLDTNVLRGRIVLLGPSAPALKDLKPTPVAGDYPGVEIHATLIDNLLAGDFLRDAPPWMLLLGTLLPTVLGAWLVLLSRKTWQSVVLLVAFLSIPLVRGFIAYAIGFWWPVVAPGLVMAVALVGAVVLNYATEGKQKRFIKSAFGQYLSSEVIDRMVNDPSSLKLGGEKKELSLFFSDIEKFSSFSEILDPPKLTSLLNDFLTEMSDTIMDEGGTLDKYVGDAIVAFWNAPLGQADHAVRACRAAVQCQRRLAVRRDEWTKTYGAVVKMRIGLNTGDVVVGNLGSSRRFAYTVLGDAANLASRLEGANKAFGTYIMVSESTWKQAQGAVVGRELGALTVVGRKTAVRVYELIGLAGDPAPDWLPAWERGLAAVRAGRWEEAAGIFEAMPGDKAAKLYVEKCRSLAGQPAAAWDGVWSLTEK